MMEETSPSPCVHSLVGEKWKPAMLVFDKLAGNLAIEAQHNVAQGGPSSVECKVAYCCIQGEPRMQHAGARSSYINLL